MKNQDAGMSGGIQGRGMWGRNRERNAGKEYEEHEEHREQVRYSGASSRPSSDYSNPPEVVWCSSCSSYSLCSNFRNNTMNTEFCTILERFKRAAPETRTGRTIEATGSGAVCPLWC